MHAIVLAGGLGTRLKASLEPGMPKALAPVAGRPFLYWLLDWLASGGVNEILISVGWQADAIVKSIGNWVNPDVVVSFCREQSPLGTGGALKLALAHSRAPRSLVVNGDTLAQVDCAKLMQFHMQESRQITLTCIRVADTGRYGCVRVNHGAVCGFEEKSHSGAGLINAGVYAVEQTLGRELPDGPHSLERDFLERHLARSRPAAFVTEGGFIDIGVPQDLVLAQSKIPGFIGN